MRLAPTTFQSNPDPDHPGWKTWDTADSKRFNPATMGKLLVRPDNGTTCRLRMFPTVSHANLPGGLHGGVTLALIDIALFASLNVLKNGDSAGAVTLDVSCQFIGVGELEEPTDAVTELLRETGRLAFMRGTVVQCDRLIASYSGIIRKATPRQ